MTDLKHDFRGCSVYTDSWHIGRIGGRLQRNMLEGRRDSPRLHERAAGLADRCQEAGYRFLLLYFKVRALGCAN